MVRWTRQQFGGLFSGKDIRSVFSTFFTGGSVIGEIIGLLGNMMEREDEVSYRDLSLSGNIYTRLIPEVFGTMRLSGNLIWSSDISIREVDGGPTMDKSGRITKGDMSRYIRASFAIAVCRGPVDAVTAIYVDGTALDLGIMSIAIYLGTEQQMPNSTIQSFMGIDQVPAFRGLCYVVFTDFPLEDFKGRVPHFLFEVKRRNFSNNSFARAAEMVTGVTVIPGGGEFVYDTIVQSQQRAIWVQGRLISVCKAQYSNAYNGTTKSDALISLEEMKHTLPKVQWVAPVVSWFANSLQASDCEIYPACENRNRLCSEHWSVAGMDRSTARLVTLDSSGRVIYGGTPSDACVLRYVTELRRREYKVCFYPILFMDILNKPWRGRISGSMLDVSRFFQHSGYREFILHYANLLNGKVDAFIIGSELIGLTKIIDAQGNCPAVECLISLAKEVKTILGPNVLITYAADWSEYHHTTNGWYNLDNLWSCNAIDVIGIDAYFPLSHVNDSLLEEADVIRGWKSGEGYDYYYADSSRTTKHPLSAPYAWKNIRYFWENVHYNPDGRQTSWVPRSKKIWFTEYGFPSVDCSTNQPNVFFSRDSTDAAFPVLSRGCIDFNAQRAAIAATERYWYNSDMVQQKFLWTWDARPYPAFPNLSHIWADSEAWQYGHFVNGKLDSSVLGEVVAYLCGAVGLRDTDFDVTHLKADIEGYVIHSHSSALQEIVRLAKVFFFDAYIADGKIVFRMLKDANVLNISEEDIVIEQGELCISINEICHPMMMPDCMEIFYIDRHRDYRIFSVYYDDAALGTNIRHAVKTNAVLAQHEAISIAQRIMLTMNAERKYYVIRLAATNWHLMPLDIAALTLEGTKHFIRIQRVTVLDSFTIEVIGIACDITCYSATLGYGTNNTSRAISVSPDASSLVSKAIFEIMDIPRYNGWSERDEVVLHIAVCAHTLPWSGCRVFVSCDGGQNYEVVANIVTETIMGNVVKVPELDINHHLTDEVSRVIVSLRTEVALASIINQDDLMTHGHLALLGEEIVLFHHIELLETGLYAISGLLRGRYGTEVHVTSHVCDERFILLTKSHLEHFTIPRAFVGKEIFVKVVSFGESTHEVLPHAITILCNSGKDLAIMTHHLTQLDNGDWLLDWIPRPRVEREFFESDITRSYSYDVIVKDGNNHIMRKVCMRNQFNFTYSVAAQLEDFGTVVNGGNFSLSIMPST